MGVDFLDLPHSVKTTKAVKQIVFEGEPLTALSVLKLREKLLGPPPDLGTCTRPTGEH